MPSLLQLERGVLGLILSLSIYTTDDSSITRTLPIHKEKFNVTLSGDEHKDLFNFVRHLKILVLGGSWLSQDFNGV